MAGEPWPWTFSKDLCSKDASGETYVNNFGFGSNLNPQKIADRGLTPLQVSRAVLHGWRLAFNQHGFPPVEPTFANLVPSPGDSVHGVLYKLSLPDFQALYTGEGGGTWYDVTKVAATYYDADVAADGSRPALALALGTGATADTTIFTACTTHLTPGGRSIPPSKRYHAMLVSGAKLSGLDPAYVAELAAQPAADPAWPLPALFTRRLAFRNIVVRQDQTTTVGWLMVAFERVYTAWSRWLFIAVAEVPVLQFAVPLAAMIAFPLLLPLMQLYDGAGAGTSSKPKTEHAENAKNTENRPPTDSKGHHSKHA